MFRSKKNIFTVLLITIGVLLSNIVGAQDISKSKYNLNETAVKNLIMAIKSDNYGLRKNAVQLAGVYFVEGAGESLVKQLQIEDDPYLRMSITKSLYLIDYNKYSNIIKNVAESDNDKNVRKFADNLYSIMQLEEYIEIAEINR